MKNKSLHHSEEGVHLVELIMPNTNVIPSVVLFCFSHVAFSTTERV